MSKDNVTGNLRAELKLLAGALEGVPSSSGDKSKGEMSRIRNKAEHALRESHHRPGETNGVVTKWTREAVAKADSYVRENPWTGVGIDAVVGVVLDVLPSRRQQWLILDTHKVQTRAYWVLDSGS